ncbi:RND transporter [Thalassovita taeanensis]|uniref:RND transporter n=1 Tax=Thalassovita taeanensis TaxID=657014 RepID=A0A1H8YRZ7_9RHOB|nr:RND transporter [Thalassovita taeanensis]SEP54936.1 hypothetical protein SAMN04488092_10128 [Thalassovita taeanensis]
MAFLDRLSWGAVLVICLTLGLAPFSPEPHIWEKLKMLMAGELRSGMDIFDMVLHGSPWGLALLKAVRSVAVARR